MRCYPASSRISHVANDDRNMFCPWGTRRDSEFSLLVIAQSVLVSVRVFVLLSPRSPEFLLAGHYAPDHQHEESRDGLGLPAAQEREPLAVRTTADPEKSVGRACESTEGSGAERKMRREPTRLIPDV